MSAIVPDTFYYPNRLVRSFYAAAGEVIGTNGFQTVLDLAGIDGHLPPDDLSRSFSFNEMSALNGALEDLYGTRGGRGMAQRIGRAWLCEGLMHFGALTGVHDPAFRVLTPLKQCHLVLLALADIFSRFSDQRCHVDDQPGVFQYVVEPSGIAWGRRAERPICAAMLGLLQEATRWATDGYEFPIHEIACQAARARACTFVIQKKPLG